jgi:hypothetical protein
MRLSRKPRERTMPTSSKVSRCYDLTGVVLAYMMAHPYCFYERAGRHYYSDAFHRFVLDLLEQYIDLDLDDFATVLQVPLDTLKEMIDSDTGNISPGELALAQKLSSGTGS